MKESLQDFGLPVPWAAASAASAHKHPQKIVSVTLSRSDPPSYVSAVNTAAANMPSSDTDVPTAILNPVVGTVAADSLPKSTLSNSSSTNTLVGAAAPKVSVAVPFNHLGGGAPSNTLPANVSLNSAANILPSSQPSTVQGTLVCGLSACDKDHLIRLWVKLKYVIGLHGLLGDLTCVLSPFYTLMV